jgi:1-aminocyclopropane-1-carboxylate deaminase
MHLHFVTRSQYREKNLASFQSDLTNRFGNFYSLPEGGSNLLAVQGCSLFASAELMDLNCDHIYLPVGTGGTMAGVICGLGDFVKVTGVSVLRNGGFLEDEIRNFAFKYSGHLYANWSLLTSYHHGGYARTTPELMNFIREMDEVYGLPLDQVYTGKLLWAIFREIEAGHVRRGAKVLAIHTGGLQGRLKAT